MGGISAPLGFIGIIGFGLFIAGIAFIVMLASQGRPVRSGIVLSVLGLVIGVVFSVISQGILSLQPTEVAVVFNVLTGQLEEPRRAGTSIVLPAIQQTTIYPINQQTFEMEANTGDDSEVRARTEDGQEVHMDVSIIYGIDPDNVNIVHQRWRSNYQNGFVRPTARSVVREVVSGYRAVQIYGQERGAMENAMKEVMRSRLAAEGLILTDLLVRDITFSTEFAASIERAQIAEQEAQQARFRVEQRRQEAEQARAVAQGERDAEIARAEGQAQSIILRAQAEAEALRLVSEQIQANPLLIQYQYIQNLADNISLALVPSNSPFLFDFNSIADGIGTGEFTAPPVPESSLDLLTPAVTPEPNTDDAE